MQLRAGLWILFGKKSDGNDSKQDVEDFIQPLAYALPVTPLKHKKNIPPHNKEIYMYDLIQGLNYKVKPNKPEICEMPPQRMIVLPVIGNPSQQTAQLMPSLYSTAYAIRKICKEQGMPFKVEKLRGRWPNCITMLTINGWKGHYGLPVPNDTTTIPCTNDNTEITPTLEEWRYGTTAQILHVGPYTEEGPTVDILLRFIEGSEYTIIANSHEEIYLTDPRKTSPDKLKTIILYRIEKQ